MSRHLMVAYLLDEGQPLNSSDVVHTTLWHKTGLQNASTPPGDWGNTLFAIDARLVVG